MIAAGDGNLSARLTDGTLLITRRGKNKAFLTHDDFALVAGNGEVLQGEPSTELVLHQKVYTTCPQARAVIHAHPPHLIAYSVVNPNADELPTAALPEVVLGIGAIPIATYGRPGTDELAQSVVKALREGYRSLVLSRHGALAWGESLLEAYNGIERMEHAAMILALAGAFGNPIDLSDDELTVLRAKFRARGMANM